MTIVSLLADYSEQHRLPLKEGIKILQVLLGDKSALRSDKTRIHFFSEGDAKLFQKFQTAFPQALFHLGNQSSMLQDLDHLAEAGEQKQIPTPLSCGLITC